MPLAPQFEDDSEVLFATATPGIDLSAAAGRLSSSAVSFTCPFPLYHLFWGANLPQSSSLIEVVAPFTATYSPPAPPISRSFRSRTVWWMSSVRDVTLSVTTAPSEEGSQRVLRSWSIPVALGGTLQSRSLRLILGTGERLIPVQRCCRVLMLALAWEE